MVAEEIICKFQYRVYFNDETGYSILKCKKKDSGEGVTCIGTNLPIQKNVFYKYIGEYGTSKYGEHFKVNAFDTYIDKSRDGILTYLSSGTIKGIGKVTAQKIYNTFGEKSIDIVENHPDELSKIKGISKATASKIVASSREVHGMKNLMELLLPYGISTATIGRIYKKHSYMAVSRIKENPYSMIDGRAFPFAIADQIAKDNGLKMDSKARMDAGLHYVFSKTESNGNLGIELSVLGNDLYQLLACNEVSKETISSYINDISNKKELIIALEDYGLGEKKYAFLKFTYEMEKACAHAISNLSQGKHATVSANELKTILNDYEKETGIHLDNVQKSAVFMAFKHSFSIITGGPGTGKTTIIKAIAEIYLKVTGKGSEDLVFAAPTGRASRRIKEQTGYDARTIHSLLGIKKGEKTYDPLRQNIDINNSLVIIDEFSMSDAYIAAELFTKLGEGNTVVIVGDPNQLPSVGAGAVLRDMIDSKFVAYTELKNIYRQNEDAQIYLNSRRIAEGNTDIKKGSDFFMYECKELEGVEDSIVNLASRAIPKYGLENVLVLVPYKKYTAGVHSLNTRLQEVINPQDGTKNQFNVGQIIYREGDIIMQLINDADKDVYNGDTGIIKTIEKINGKNSITAEINGNLVTYSGEELENIQLAYARTIHKAQGSEARCVITCLTNFHRMMLIRNLPYTAITRAKEVCIFIGEKDALDKAILNTSPLRRVTLLKEFLKNYFVH